MRGQLTANPNPWSNVRLLTPEAPKRSRVTQAIGVGALAVIAAIGAYVHFSDSASSPTPKASGSHTEATASLAVSTAIDAYISAVAEGRGEPTSRIDVAADPQSAAAAAYVNRYPRPGLQTLLTGRG